MAVVGGHPSDGSEGAIETMVAEAEVAASASDDQADEGEDDISRCDDRSTAEMAPLLAV